MTTRAPHTSATARFFAVCLLQMPPGHAETWASKKSTCWAFFSKSLGACRTTADDMLLSLLCLSEAFSVCACVCCVLCVCCVCVCALQASLLLVIGLY